MRAVATSRGNESLPSARRHRSECRQRPPPDSREELGLAADDASVWRPFTHSPIRNTGSRYQHYEQVAEPEHDGTEETDRDPPSVGDLVEHPPTDRIRYSSDGDKRRAMLVNGAVVHECGDFSSNGT